jgi:ligand-binding sensor domain-containing protein
MSTVQFFAGLAIVALIGFAAFNFWPRADPPPGWQTIRPPYDVMALAEFNGHIWAGGRDGLLAIDRQTGRPLEKISDELDFKYVTALLVTNAGGTLWVGHMDGLSQLNTDGWKTYGQDDGLPDNRILSLAEDRATNLWIGTRSGIARWSKGEFQAPSEGYPLGSEPVSVIYADSGGRLWFGNGYSTSGGLARYDGARWRSYSTEDGLAHHMVNAILEDEKGWLWFGTGFSSLGGASIYDGQSWRTITKEDGLAGEKVRSLFLDSASSLWVGSEYDGIALQEEGGWRIYTPDDGLAGWEVKAMLQDSQDNLWLGTEGGLTRIGSSAWRNLVDEGAAPE